MTDFKGIDFCGLDNEWDYFNGWVDISMNYFLKKTHTKLLHTPPKRPQHAPYQWMLKTYKSTQQFATPPDTSPVLDKADITYVQRVVGSF